MSSYLYAVVPYESGLQFPEETEDKFVYGMPKELNGISVDIDEECFCVYADFILINTCWRMSYLSCDENGWCKVRSEIYKVAKALNASEAWYVEELSTDIMLEPGFDFEDWKRSLREELAYCTCEVNIEMLRNQEWASLCHDDFADIVIERTIKSNNNTIM